MNVRAVYENLRAHPHPLRYALGVALYRSRLCRFLHIRHRDFSIRFHPTTLSLSMWIDPDCRRFDHEFFRGYLRSGDSVIDVGANIGSLTLTAAAAVGPRGQVVAIEADPRISNFLRANCADNGADQVEIVTCAVGASESIVSLSRQEDDSASYISTERSDLAVRVRPLDAVVAHVHGQVALLKIDVEGYELDVLLGAAATLARTDCVYFEAWEPLSARYRKTTADVIRVLDSAGLRVYRFVSDRTITRVPSDFVATSLENLVALRDPHAFSMRTSHVIGEAS